MESKDYDAAKTLADTNTQLQDEYAKRQGFESYKEKQELMARVNAEGMANLKAFGSWNAFDGSKAGLLKLPTVEPKTVTFHRTEYETISVPKHCIPERMRLVEAYEGEKQIVVLGEPEAEPDEHDDSWYETAHNCDAMGCGTLSHVMFIFDKALHEKHRYTLDAELEDLEKAKQLLCAHFGGLLDNSVSLGIEQLLEQLDTSNEDKRFS